MEIEVFESAEEAARRAADIVFETTRAQERAAIGLPSGRTPERLYAELARRVRAGDLDLSGVTTFAIDELHGVPRAHPATNASYFATRLRNVPLRALHVLDSEAREPERECARFTRLIADAGGLDLAVLGIAPNGHIAFNEPGSAFDSRARRVALAEETRATYAPAFGSIEATPAFGLTLGIADLLDARRALLLALGSDKADVVAAALEGSATEALPASALQRHERLTVLLDRAAASQLARPR